MSKIRMVGRKIQELAELKGITTLDLAKELELSENQARKLFIGRLILTFKQLQKAADLFDVTIEEFLDYDENKVDKNKKQVLDLLDDYLDLLEFSAGP